MDSKYQELLRQRDALDERIKAEYQLLRDSACATAAELIKRYELTSKEVFGVVARARTSGPKVAIKYLEPGTGRTWTGRGKEPVWIRGKDRAAFLVGVAP